MNQPITPAVTVTTGDGRYTFAPGHDVVIGRDVRAHVRVPHPGVSRSHVLLRVVDGSWVALDDQSMHGIYVAGQRVSSVDVHNGVTLALGDPAGPQLTFELGATPPPSGAATVQLQTIGRTAENDIVVPDVLASRHHATLLTTDTGIRIQSTDTVNTTFVNGEPISDTTLSDDDIVTIGNVDFVFTKGNLERRTAAAATTGGLEVHDVSLTVGHDVVVLDRISLTARPGTLTAVIGPSGSGKTTLSRVISGGSRPASGTVSFERRDLHRRFAALRSRIGMVPQDDIVHTRLTVVQALTFAAELRMPADTTADERAQVVSQVLAELELSPHADTRIDKLSGGQRKRVSVAMELLTGPSLLVLDEPTTGLDPALDRSVMTMLRQLADAGRVVVVVTHSLTFLDVCDQVLLLAPGGKTAYCGPPAELEAAIGASDWADIFTIVSDDPEGARRRFADATGAPAGDPAQNLAADLPMESVEPARTGLWHQFSTLTRRQITLLLADRGHLILLAVLPFIVGLLPLTVIGDAGFGRPLADGSAPLEPKHVIALTSFAAILMGTTLTARDLVGERLVFRREQSAGLSASAYLLAKIVVFGAVAALQSVVLVLIVTAPGFGKPVPQDAVLLGSPRLELIVGVAATGVSAAVLGLMVSALARTGDQVIVLLAAALTTQLVLAGGFIAVTGRPAIGAVASIMPGRWGFSATASTADLNNLVAGIPHDPLWEHSASVWLLDMVMLGLLTLVFAAVARWRLRIPATS